MCQAIRAKVYQLDSSALIIYFILFTGTLRIKLTAIEETTAIIIHGRDINVTSYSLHNKYEKRIDIRRFLEYPPHQQVCREIIVHSNFDSRDRCMQTTVHWCQMSVATKSCLVWMFSGHFTLKSLDGNSCPVIEHKILDTVCNAKHNDWVICTHSESHTWRELWDDIMPCQAQMYVPTE